MHRRPIRLLHLGMPARRRWLQQAVLMAASATWPSRRAGAQAHSVTAEAMREARDAEMGVYYRYSEWGRQAQREGYRGIAYLFVAFASAEFIHANNFGRILVRLNVEAPPVPKPAIKPANTRENLIAAANGEAHSVDDFYPRLLEKIRSEGYADAMQVVQWAWNTEKQHREKIRQIQRYSPSFFGMVARNIDEKTGQYYVCQICGNTVNQVPAGQCGVCGNASTNFRLIDPPES
jgi:rubrerythrin